MMSTFWFHLQEVLSSIMGCLGELLLESVPAKIKS